LHILINSKLAVIDATKPNGLLASTLKKLQKIDELNDQLQPQNY